MKPIKIAQTEHSQELFLESDKRTTSAVLIPMRLMSVFRKLLWNKNKTQVLSYLLNRYKAFNAFGYLGKSEKLKMKFQSKGQNLQRVTFKPLNSDWAELSILSNSTGLTKAYLFTIFLELEDRGISSYFQHPRIRNEVSYIFKRLASCTIRILPGAAIFQRILHYYPPG